MKHKTVQGFHKTVCVFVIPWTYAPVASKVGASHLKQSRHRGAFHLNGMTQTRPMFCSISARFCFMLNYSYKKLLMDNNTEMYNFVR